MVQEEFEPAAPASEQPQDLCLRPCGNWNRLVTDTRNITLRLLMSYIYIYIYMEHLFLMFLDHTQGRTTAGRTPLDEWSARPRDLYLTTHDTHNRQISMPPVGFEPKISAGERPVAAHLLRSCSKGCLALQPNPSWRIMSCHFSATAFTKY